MSSINSLPLPVDGVCGGTSCRTRRSIQITTHTSSATPASSHDSASPREASTSEHGSQQSDKSSDATILGKILLLQACYPDMMKLMVPNGARQVDVCGFSAGSFTGLAVHSVLSDFACFPGDFSRPTPLGFR